MKKTFEVECPHCGHKGETRTESAGREVRCKACQGEFVAPKLCARMAKAVRKAVNGVRFWFWAGCLGTGTLGILRIFFPLLRAPASTKPWETYERAGLLRPDWTGTVIQAAVLLGLCVLFWALATARLPLARRLTKDVQKRREEKETADASNYN